MERKIRRAAVKAYRLLNGKPESERIIAALKKIDYEVVFYNTVDGDAVVKAYGFQSLAASKNAFVCCGSKKRFVFVDNNLSASEKKYALLHEMGHILLGHVGNSTAHLLDSQTNEVEANAFVCEILSPTHTAYLPFAVAVLLILSIMVQGFIRYNKTTGVYAHSQTEDTLVYITATGSKYHTKNCIYIVKTDYAAITASQARKIFSPCNVCNPNISA